MLHAMVYIDTRTKSKDQERSMQKLYTTTLSCKHEFQVRVHSKSSGILPITGLFEIVCCTRRGTAGIFQAEQEASH